MFTKMTAYMKKISQILYIHSSILSQAVQFILYFGYGLIIYIPKSIPFRNLTNEGLGRVVTPTALLPYSSHTANNVAPIALLLPPIVASILYE